MLRKLLQEELHLLYEFRREQIKHQIFLDKLGNSKWCSKYISKDEKRIENDRDSIDSVVYDTTPMIYKDKEISDCIKYNEIVKKMHSNKQAFSSANSYMSYNNKSLFFTPDQKELMLKVIKEM